MLFASRKFIQAARAIAAGLMLLALGGRALLARPLAAGHVPRLIRQLQPLGEVPATNQLKLAIGLPWRNAAALSNLLQELYDPASPHYRRFLTSDEFTARFAPTEADYQAVADFARSNHLIISGRHGNRVLLDVSGSAADVQRAFHVRLLKYRHPRDARECFAPDAEPSVEGNVPILDVSGLDDFGPPRPCISSVSNGTGFAVPQAGSAPNGAYIGNDFRAAYLPGVAGNGSGQALGLVEFDGFYPNDIATYKQQAGLPDVPVQTVLIDSYNGTPSPGLNFANGEVSLDIEVAIAMATNLTRVIVYSGGPEGTPNDILNRMSQDSDVKQLSCSWGWTGGPQAATDQIFQKMAAQGQSFFCASGDSDAYLGSVVDDPSQQNTPTDNPYITVVGGTSLTTAGPGGAWVSEKVWNAGGGTGSGGGISSYYAIPSWQQGIDMLTNGGSGTMRNIPDVALTADNVYVVYGNGTGKAFIGTSCAAPLWAGLMALVNQQATSRDLGPVGFANPAIYALAQGVNYAADFHDITVGNNSYSSSRGKYSAVTGYDLCTGWGTPAGTRLIDELAGASDPLVILPVAGFTANGLAGGPFSITSQTFALSNSGPSALAWGLSNSAPWLDVSRMNGSINPAASPTMVAFALNAAANTLGTGNYEAVVWFTNLNTGNVQNRLVTLNVLPQLVQNGGFETGNFTDWTKTGNGGFTTVVTSGTYVHSGKYGTQLGPTGVLGFLSQIMSTTVAQPYLISFWLVNPAPGTPNEFKASWNGATLFDQTNLPAFGWTNLQFIVSGTNGNSTLQFGFRNDIAYFGLDDIEVLPITVPVFQNVTQQSGQIQFTWNAMTGQSYEVQYKTNLSQTNWINLSAVIATNSMMSFMDSTSMDTQRYYRIVVLP